MENPESPHDAERTSIEEGVHLDFKSPPSSPDNSLQRILTQEPTQKARSQEADAFLRSALNEVGYAEERGAYERNIGISTNIPIGEQSTELYTGISHVESSGETPLPFIGTAIPLDETGRQFTVEFDPRSPMTSQFLAIHQPFGDTGALRFGASFGGLGTQPSEYSLAAEMGFSEGRAGLSVAIIPPTPDEKTDINALLSYRIDL